MPRFCFCVLTLVVLCPNVSMCDQLMGICRPSKPPVKAGMEPRQQNLPVTPAEPTDAELWKDRGNKAFSANNYAQAKQDYTQSIALQPSCLAYANRAMAELKLEEFSAAEADCTKAIALDAAYVKAYLRRASAAKQQGKLLQAAEDYEHALRLEPTSKATLADARACFDQLLQQEGLQAQPPRLTIPISHAAAQSPAANTSTNASSAAALPATAQPLSSTQSTSQAPSQLSKPSQSQQDMAPAVPSSPAALAQPSEQSQPSAPQQSPGTSSRPSAAKSAESSQQSKPSTTAGKEPSNLQRPSSQSEGPPTFGHVPHAGRHTRSHYGMAAQRRRAEPTVVIEEVLSDEEDVTGSRSQGMTTACHDGAAHCAQVSCTAPGYV